MRSFIHTSAELTAYVEKIGFLPLLNLGVGDWSAEAAADEEAQYTRLPEGGWEWPLWQWKGDVLRESGCAYGKFFDRKTGFVSREWWPDFCNHRRSRLPQPEPDSVEQMILQTLREHGSLTTRGLRAACGLGGPNIRGRFDTLIARLQMCCRVVTEDFVYPHDRHGRQYGWGWAVLTTPEARFGRAACQPDRTPEESYSRLLAHFRQILPGTSDEQIRLMLR